MLGDMSDAAAGRAASPESVLGHRVHWLDPAGFAFVMATGIVSSAIRVDGFMWLSVALLLIALAGYVLLVGASAWRVARWTSAVVTDVQTASAGFGFLTFVAGTGVLAGRLAEDGHFVVTAVLLGIAVLAWLLLAYGVPLALLVHRHDGPLLAGANGSWFLWTVAAESIAVSCSDLISMTRRPHPHLALLAVSAWSIGVVLYLVLAALVGVRLLTYPLPAAELVPSYWIFMGATAITVLAGSRILTGGPAAQIPAIRAVIAGLSFVLWAFGTWLVPLLLAGSIWRHVQARGSRLHHTGLWSMVFPLGMYAVASRAFGAALSLPALHDIGACAAWVALAAWIGTAAVTVRGLSPRRR